VRIEFSKGIGAFVAGDNMHFGFAYFAVRPRGQRIIGVGEQ
jgi:hypothetical protein